MRRRRCEIMQVARFVSILATLEDLLVLEMAQFALLRERRLQYRSSTYWNECIFSHSQIWLRLTTLIWRGWLSLGCCTGCFITFWELTSYKGTQYQPQTPLKFDHLKVIPSMPNKPRYHFPILHNVLISPMIALSIFGGGLRLHLQ